MSVLFCAAYNPMSLSAEFLLLIPNHHKVVQECQNRTSALPYPTSSIFAFILNAFFFTYIYYTVPAKIWKPSEIVHFNSVLTLEDIINTISLLKLCIHFTTANLL